MKEKPLSTYIINLKNRTDRKAYILKEFAGRDEFNINIVEGHEHKVGAVGLWNTIRHIIQNLANQKDEYILICEDDHQFTGHYSKGFLFNCIREVQGKEADVLLGGVSSTRSVLSISKSLFWLEKFSGLQFTILFRKFFKTILEADFGNNDAADYKISALTANKFFIYPFISVQKEFGYSDATAKNNTEGRVTELFSTTSETVQHLLNVAAFYKTIRIDKSIKNEQETFDNIIIPTYVINLPERTERREHIQTQFEGRKEFDLRIVKACKHEIGAVGLWNTIRKIVQMSIDNEDDVIIICEDDHKFTNSYSKEFLIKNIIEAHQQGADILAGGIGNFIQVVPLTETRLWIDSFWSTQFIILYRKFFASILEEPFDNTVVPDDLLSKITSNKMTLFPFISVQKDFGYSDISQRMYARATPDIFAKTSKRIEDVKRATDKYLLRPNNSVSQEQGASVSIKHRK